MSIHVWSVTTAWGGSRAGFGSAAQLCCAWVAVAAPGGSCTKVLLTAWAVSCEGISQPDTLRVYCPGVPPEGPSALYRALPKLDLETLSSASGLKDQCVTGTGCYRPTNTALVVVREFLSLLQYRQTGSPFTVPLRQEKRTQCQHWERRNQAFDGFLCMRMQHAYTCSKCKEPLAHGNRK